MESNQKRIFVTGGSGFIGTNLISLLTSRGYEVCNADIQSPRNPAQNSFHRHVDLLDANALKQAMSDFAPSCLVHLAARTDLDGKTLDEYSLNTVGTQNLIEAVTATPSVTRTIFTSSKLACKSGIPCEIPNELPETIYGQSKAKMEQIIRAASNELTCCWCIVRPSSIWGPWYSIPYHQFLLSVARGRYVHPGKCDPPRGFGYVENYAFQNLCLIEAPAEKIQGQVFYLSDYDIFTIRNWANAIAAATRKKKIRTIPSPIMRLLALVGDVCKILGWKSVPMTSFRLRNMWTDTTHLPRDNTQALTGPLPYTMEQGVQRTVDWMRSEGVIG